MYKWKAYLKLQLKRVLKTLPGILLQTCILTLGILLLMQLVLAVDASKEKNKLIRVGIVGDASDSYLGIGINVLKNTDAIKSMADIDSMSEEAAKDKLASGEISAYLIIPDGFVYSVLVGENKPLTYVTTAEAQGIGGILVNELMGSVSQMITMSQNAVYAMQHYLVAKDMRENIYDATEQLNIHIIGAVLNRMDFYELQQVGVANNLSLKGYYVCGILILFLLLWGINCVSLFAGEDVAMNRILYRKGYGYVGQVLSEFVAYFVLMLVSIGCMLMAGMIIMNAVGLEIPEWKALDAGERILFFGRLLPIIGMLSAFQLLLDELVPGILNAVLVQFICGVSLGYISGCLYPISFFPEAIQIVSFFLPTGVGLRYLQNGLSASGKGWDILLILLYTALFLGIHMLRRRQRIVGK